MADPPAAPTRRRLARALDPQLHPGQGLSTLNRAIIVLILASILVGILGTEETIQARSPRLFLAFELLALALFVVEYHARLWVSIENPRHASRLAYALKPAALLDLAAIAVIALSLVGAEGFLLRLARLLRLVRLARLGRFSQAWRTLAAAIHERRYELALSLCAVFPLLLLTSVLLYLVEGAAQPGAFGSIPRAMWWSIATLTTVGYGDAGPITALGKAFAALAALAGIGLIALPAGILAGAFSEVVRTSRDARARPRDRS